MSVPMTRAFAKEMADRIEVMFPTLSASVSEYDYNQMVILVTNTDDDTIQVNAWDVDNGAKGILPAMIARLYAHANGLVFMTRGDQRHYTEGEAEISGATDTSVEIAHGLLRAPRAQDIVVTATSDLEAASFFYISDVGVNTFKINLDAAPGSGKTATFAWRAQLLP